MRRQRRVRYAGRDRASDSVTSVSGTSQAPIEATVQEPRGPTRTDERALAPDLARGLMLLMIVLANTPWYLYGSTAGLTTAHPDGGRALDRVTQLLIITFVDSRVYPMFAFLFGYGMVQLFSRQVAAGTPVKAARRLLRLRNLWLLVFGFVHAALLWYGDVLGAYGLAGLVLVALFFKRKDRTLLIWAMALAGSLVTSMLIALMGAPFAARYPMNEGTFTSSAALRSWPGSRATRSRWRAGCSSGRSWSSVRASWDWSSPP